MAPGQRIHVRQRVAFRLFKLPFASLLHWLGGKGLRLPMAIRIRRVEQANNRALMRYRPQAYPGDIVLYRAAEAGEGDEATLGWRRWIEGRIEVVDIPGRHDNFIDQPELARALRARIKQAMAGYSNARVRDIACKGPG